MGFVVSVDVLPLVTKARMKLGLTQRELAEALRSSLRTVSRWEARQSVPADFHLHALAKLLHPVDPALARDVASGGGKTLEELGIAAPPASASADPPAPLPAAFAPRRQPLVEAIVLSAAEALEAEPGTLRGVRAAVLAAFTRTRELELGIDDVAQVLSAVAPSAAGTQRAGDDRGKERPSARAATRNKRSRRR